MAMLVCIAAMSVFTSCKDEKSNAELILGKRNVDKIFVNGTETEEGNIHLAWEFKSNGAAFLTMTSETATMPMNWTYTIDNTRIVINRTDGDELINAAILKLDEKVPEYEYTEEESGMV